jgi:predicted HD phosphohydrolase
MAPFTRTSRPLADSNHVLQSANLAMKNGMSEEIILACLLHDTVQELIKVDHGWWGAMLYEPYVSEKVAFAIRYHQALRFYPLHF